MKKIYSKPTANIKWNGKILEVIPRKSGTKQGCSLFSYPFNIVVGVLTRIIKQQMEIKEIQIGKEKVKASLFPDDIIVYISDKNSIIRELLQLINKFSKMAK